MPPRKTRALDKANLTEIEQKFVEAYVDPTKTTYRNGTRSMAVASPHTKTTALSQNGSNMIRRPQVKAALKELLDKPKYKQIIEKKLFEMLEKDDTRDRDRLGAMDFYAKITGAYSPEKHMNLNLTPEDRESKYQEILAKVRGEQNKQGIQTHQDVSQSTMLPQPTSNHTQTEILYPEPNLPPYESNLPERTQLEGPDATPPTPVFEEDTQDVEEEDEEDPNTY